MRPQTSGVDQNSLKLTSIWNSQFPPNFAGQIQPEHLSASPISLTLRVKFVCRPKSYKSKNGAANIGESPHLRVERWFVYQT